MTFTLEIAHIYSVLLWARTVLGLSQLICLHPEDEGEFSFLFFVFSFVLQLTHMTFYLIESLLMLRTMFYVVDLGSVRIGFSESYFGFLCSRLCTITALTNWFLYFSI